MNMDGERTLDLSKLVIYRTPVRPGVSLVFYNDLLSTKLDPKLKRSLTNSPGWALHTEMMHFFVSAVHSLEGAAEFK